MNEPTANESTVNEPTNAAAACCAEVDECVRRNPGTTLLVAVGAGLVIGLIVRGLRPAPPRHRLMEFLEDLQDRVTPVARKAATMAGDGVDVLREHAHDGEAWLQRYVKGARCRLGKMFS